MNLNQFFLNKYYYCFIALTCILLSCNNKKGKGDYKRTVPICNNLFVEVYRTFGSGAFGSDLVDDYLTDSLNFRVRIGNSDEYYGGFYYHCKNDSITIEKLYMSETDSIRHTIEIKNYSKEKLITLKNILQQKTENISDNCVIGK